MLLGFSRPEVRVATLALRAPNHTESLAEPFLPQNFARSQPLTHILIEVATLRNNSLSVSMALRKAADAFARTGLSIRCSPALVESTSFAQCSLTRLYAKGTVGCM